MQRLPVAGYFAKFLVGYSPRAPPHRFVFLVRVLAFGLNYSREWDICSMSTLATLKKRSGTQLEAALNIAVGRGVAAFVRHLGCLRFHALLHGGRSA